MQIIKDKKVIDDQWSIVADDITVDQLPEGDVIVPLALWLNSKKTLLQHQGQLGLSLNSDADLEAIADDLNHFAVIALQFPTFRDGRGYSASRALRQHYGYQGEVRAIGNVLRDQIQFMARVGINSFAIDPKQDIHDALNAFDEISVKYQASTDEPLPLYKRRA